MEIVSVGDRVERLQRFHIVGVAPGGLPLLRDRRRDREIVVVQAGARRRGGRGPVPVHVGFVVLETGHIWPTVVFSSLDQVDFIVGLGTMFRREQPATWSED